MYKPILTALAVFGQFLALFPFIASVEQREQFLRVFLLQE